MHFRLNHEFADRVNLQTTVLALVVLSDQDNGAENEVALDLGVKLSEQEGNEVAQREILRQYIEETDAVLRTLGALLPDPLLVTYRQPDKEHPTNAAPVRAAHA
jgi:hypothetical protein